MATRIQITDEELLTAEGAAGKAAVRRIRFDGKKEKYDVWFDGNFVNVCGTESEAEALAATMAQPESEPTISGGS